MEIELRLRELLIDHGVNPKARGLITELAQRLKVHRHTARRLLFGNMQGGDTKGVNTISLQMLGVLCNWLHHDHNVPMHRLPKDLFGFAPPSDLWQAVSSVRTTTLFLGEYCQLQGDGPARLWVSSRDCTVANAIIEQLCRFRSNTAEAENDIHTEYVPFRFANGTDDQNTRQKDLDRDIRTARQMFGRTYPAQSNSSHIYIGSQEVNGMLECWVSSVFGCKPFVQATKEAKTPFYVWFRHPDSSVKSCFGGVVPPPGYTGEGGAGIYYRKGNRWLACPFIEGRKDTGLVITYRDPGANIVDVAIFGLSGRATAAMADRVVPNTERFYPPAVSWRGTQLGVYVCKFVVTGSSSTNTRTYQIKRFEVIPIEEKILKQYLPSRKTRKSARKSTRKKN